jgi:hypothetical protein
MIITDLKSPKIRIIENAVSESVCNSIIAYSNNNFLWENYNIKRHSGLKDEDLNSVSHQWHNRRIEIDHIYENDFEKNKDLFSLLIPIHNLMYDQTVDFFKPETNIYSEIWKLAKWHDPYFQKPHTDYLDPDFDLDLFDINSVPEECRYFFEKRNIDIYKKTLTTKHYAALLYLNDDYEGGEIYFPQHDYFEYKPKPGSIVILEGNIDYMHGVKKVSTGTRYTVTNFWTKNSKASSKIATDRIMKRIKNA